MGGGETGDSAPGPMRSRVRPWGSSLGLGRPAVAVAAGPGFRDGEGRGPGRGSRGAEAGRRARVPPCTHSWAPAPEEVRVAASPVALSSCGATDLHPAGPGARRPSFPSPTPGLRL